MLKTILNNVNKSTIYNFYNISNNILNIQCVRWLRKPSSLPVAKSKMFRIPVKKANPEEHRELLILHNLYKTQMRSVRHFFAQENLKNEKVTSLELITEEAEQDFKRSTAINTEWNNKIAAERQQRLDTAMQVKREKILKQLQKQEKRERKSLEKVESIVRDQKIKAESFITPDKIDAAIEYALANPSDYNFAIDLQQNIYQGRRTTEPTVKTNSNSNDNNDGDGDGDLQLLSAKNLL